MAREIFKRGKAQPFDLVQQAVVEAFTNTFERGLHLSEIAQESGPDSACRAA